MATSKPMDFEVGKINALFSVENEMFSITLACGETKRIYSNVYPDRWVDVQRGSIVKMPTTDRTGSGWLRFTFYHGGTDRELCTLAKWKKVYHVYMRNELEEMCVFTCSTLTEAKSFIQRDSGGKKNRTEMPNYISELPHEHRDYVIYEGEPYIYDEDGNIIDEHEPVWQSDYYYGSGY